MTGENTNSIIYYLFLLLFVLSIVIFLLLNYDLSLIVTIIISSAFVISPFIFKKDIRKYLVPIQVFALSTFIVHIFLKGSEYTIWSISIYFATLFFSLLWLVSITEKGIQTHRKTKERLQKYSKVLEKVPFVILIHNRNDIVYSNSKYKEFFGTKNILTNSFELNNIENCRSHKEKDIYRSSSRICRVETLKGERWCSFRTEQIDGMDNYFITVVLDHTDFVSSGEQIKELINIEKRIFNSLPVGVAIINQKNGIEFSNDVFSEIISGKRIPLKVKRGLCPINCSTNECVLETGEEYIETFDGDIKGPIYQLRCIPVKHNKETSEVAVILRDVSEEKKYIELLQNLSSSSNLVMRLSELIASGVTGFEDFGREIFKVIHNELKLCDHMFIAKKISEKEILIEFGVIEDKTVSGKKIDFDSPSLTKHVLNTSKTLYLTDIKKSNIESYVPEEMKIDERPITFYGVPLKISGKTQGIAAFESWGEDQYDESKKEIFDIIASQLEVLIKIQSSIKEMYDEKNKLKKIVVRDKLTGAYNRNFLDEYIKKIQAINKRQKENSALVMLDINDFKKINDQKGHIFGDKVLKLVSKVIGSSLREMDVFIRYGGDEFIIVLPETTEEKADKVMQRVTEELEAQSEKEINMKIAISYGISYFGEAQDYYKAIKTADDLMYKMKNSNPET
ncbi:MAG: GGDEF domain-containing protein [Kosmotoga sp.]|nr:MAG: GGDEF domain-containing protein [Kosmotoga sp.]